MDEERSISDASESENTRGKIIGKMRDNFRQNSHKGINIFFLIKSKYVSNLKT